MLLALFRKNCRRLMGSKYKSFLFFIAYPVNLRVISDTFTVD